MMHIEIAFVALLGIAAAVALLARRIKVPYTVALVAAGLLLGNATSLAPPQLTKDLLYTIFLPGLIFEAAFHLEFREFWRNRVAIHALAVPGLIASILLTAFLLTPVAQAMHFVDGFALAHGLVFASLIAATDPIAVVGLFKTMGAPKRLALLVEGESLLNDGTAVVVFSILLAGATGMGFTWWGAALDFVTVVGMGTLIGGAVGLVVSKVVQSVDDPMIEITLTTIAAYGSFLVAEQFHYSGVIATVVAGMLCGNYAARTGMSPSTRVAVESFWEYVVFALNSVVFLLVGLHVRIDALLASWKAILVAWFAVTVGRAVVIVVVSALLAKTKERLPTAWTPVLTWGGLRGALSMVLALGLPAAFVHRELIVNMTFGVVLLSILVQGLTMAPLLGRLGLASDGHDRHEYERRKGGLLAAGAGLAALERMQHERQAPPDVLDALVAEYSNRVAVADRRIRELHLEDAVLLTEQTEAVRRQLLNVEKDELLRARRVGAISNEAFEYLAAEIDERLQRLDWGEPLPAKVSANQNDETSEKGPVADETERPPK